ncbi:HK97 gp10 family phage protein [Pasteurella multocida]|uniref:HK97 gp10 family phage protein n=1 Tax=Pasteurella multocida TaxID=747 RepID=UPI00234143E8|nr:HK97 gp10 family phage protein [Pasteurella multocida]MDC4238381.1 HK97 gp10 family phage protein [Pasteurella multocida]HDR1174248.1 HK97 gp10 family phage protein [Pasteurella multocida]HDR1911749.1 HK97 gp10 family phage protein [Pasteurella multocida]
MAVKSRGFSQAKKKLSVYFSEVKSKKMTRAAARIVTIIGIRSALYTPIDTSTLINSQFKEISVKDSVVSGRVGYSAEYAVFVHDPKVKQKFKRPTARKEFLKRVVDDEDIESEIKRIIKEELG